MENTPLRQLLRSLCHDFQWEYAVFWRLKHRSRMLLTWEDGYCNNPKPRENVERISENVHFSENTRVASINSEINQFNGLSVGYPVELAVASMSCLLHSFGEGYVGRVASTGKHCWIFSDEYNSRSLPEYPDELHLQFGVGIKTILLVPVTPHGVMQLGSLKKVNEDSALVGCIQHMFSTFQHNLGAAMLPTSITDLGPSSLTSSPSASTSNILKPIQSKMEIEDPMALTNIILSNSIPEMKLQFVDQDHHHVQDNSFHSRKHIEFGDLPMGSTMKRKEPDAPSLSYQDEDLQFPFQFDFTDFSSYPFYGTTDQQFGETSLMTDEPSSHGFPNFTTDYELPKFSYEDVCSNGGIKPSVSGSYELFLQGGDADGLFEAMVSTMYDPSCDMSSFKLNTTTQTQTQSPLDLVHAPTTSPSKSSSRSTKSSLINEDQQKGYGCTQSKKSSKCSHNVNKKVKQNDTTQRARPRDRQMIQDRVKELRELVPNGGKCSIDSLLDQTIKHMLFLRGVTDRAEKLKQCVYPEDRNNSKSSENHGASWAFELGNEFGSCPIVVKDLEQPGHMLIEMLCEENGLFLEIAQAIRRLELTILKGVMENRVDKSWARFIVEASAGFRRMDIFWPLMQLLQRNSSISSMI